MKWGLVLSWLVVCSRFIRVYHYMQVFFLCYDIFVSLTNKNQLKRSLKKEKNGKNRSFNFHDTWTQTLSAAEHILQECSNLSELSERRVLANGDPAAYEAVRPPAGPGEPGQHDSSWLLDLPVWQRQRQEHWVCTGAWQRRDSPVPLAVLIHVDHLGLCCHATSSIKCH